jgi:hypothetical protein
MNKLSLFLSGILTATLCLSASAVRAESFSEQADRLTDWIFHRANPELNDRKLAPTESAYIAEWNTIRAAVEEEAQFKVMQCASDDRAVYLPDYDAYPHYGFKGNLYRSTSLDRIADRIFYHRNPEYGSQRIQRGDRAAARQWQVLREKISLTDPCD